MVGRVEVDMDSAATVFTKVFHKGSGPDRNMKNRAQRVGRLARSLAPKRTGALAASIRVDQSRVDGRFSFGYNVAANAPYAVYVHEGTRPHVIRPRGAGYPLSFVWKGQRVAFMYVNHPGNRAQPFLANALVAAGG